MKRVRLRKRKPDSFELYSQLKYQSFPKLNEVIKFDNFEFKIIKSTSRKIELVELHIIK